MKFVAFFLLTIFVFGFRASASYEPEPSLNKDTFPKTCVVIATMENNNIQDLTTEQMATYKLFTLSDQTDNRLIIDGVTFFFKEKGLATGKRPFRLYVSKLGIAAVIFNKDKNTILLFAGGQNNEAAGRIINCFSE